MKTIEKHGSGWVSCSNFLPPDGTLVETIISDSHGTRNYGRLKRMGKLWFVPAGDMYVYYTPTHWREIKETNKLYYKL